MHRKLASLTSAAPSRGSPRPQLGEGPAGAVVGGAAIGNSIANGGRYSGYGCAYHYSCRHHHEYDGWMVDGGGLEVPARSGRRERPKTKIRGVKIISALYDILISFIRVHESLAAPIVFGLAFGESIAFVSLLLPATVILFGIGGLIGATGIGFWPISLGAALGAVLGDWLSYWLGLHYKHEIAHMWPLSRRPDLLPKGEAFFRRWGVAGSPSAGSLGRCDQPFPWLPESAPCLRRHFKSQMSHPPLCGRQALCVRNGRRKMVDLRTGDT